MVEITVFTPTYNRAYIIHKLYQSLCLQSNLNFEWLIVDDGSTDNTENLINSFVAEDKILIRYIKQNNGGKHRAINKGVQLAKGELFFIVDSDDQLPPTSIEQIIKYYSQVKSDLSFAGVCGLKYYFSGERVGGSFPYQILDCNSVEFRYKYHVKGDVAEVFKTEILKMYPFPTFDNEKFCFESLVWNRIALKYKLRYFNEAIYLCEYLVDGLSKRSVQLRMRSPKAAMVGYSELFKMDVPMKIKIKSAINFWRFSFCAKENFYYKIKRIGFVSLFLYPLGLLFHLKDLRK